MNKILFYLNHGAIMFMVLPLMSVVVSLPTTLLLLFLKEVVYDTLIFGAADPINFEGFWWIETVSRGLAIVSMIAYPFIIKNINRIVDYLDS
jgi:hypothetical protein